MEGKVLGGGDVGSVVARYRRAKRVLSGLRSRLTPEPDTRQMLLELREELRQTLRPTLAKLRTLAEIAAEWLPQKLQKIASAASFEGRVRNHILPALGHHTSQTLRKRDVEVLLLDLRHGRGLSAQTANHVRDAGRQLVQDALENGEWSGANPFAQVEPFPLEERDYDVLSRQEARAVLAAVPDRWRPLFALAVYLGPRRSTILNVRVADVDLEARVISFLKTKTGKKIRRIPIPDELLPYLQEAVARAGPGEWLFPTRFGKKHAGQPKALNRVLRRAMQAAGVKRPDGGLPRLSFHGLRRTSSCLHQEAGCAAWVVSKVLGHSQASLVFMGNMPENVTARHYSTYSENFIREQLNRLTLQKEE